MPLKKSQKSLNKWTKQNWTTPSGKKSSETGEVYAPAKTISKLKSTPSGRKKLALANKKKREATSKGEQYAKIGCQVMLITASAPIAIDNSHNIPIAFPVITAFKILRSEVCITFKVLNMTNKNCVTNTINPLIHGSFKINSSIN